MMLWLGGALATLGGLAMAARVRDLSMMEPLALVKMIVLWPVVYAHGLSGQADHAMDAAMHDTFDDAEFEECHPAALPEACAEKEAVIAKQLETLNAVIREHVVLCPKCEEIEKRYTEIVGTKDG